MGLILSKIYQIMKDKNKNIEDLYSYIELEGEILTHCGKVIACEPDSQTNKSGAKDIRTEIFQGGEHNCDYIGYNKNESKFDFIEKKNLSTILVPGVYEEKVNNLVFTMHMKVFSMTYTTTALGEFHYIPINRRYKHRFIFIVEGEIKHFELFEDLKRRLVQIVNGLILVKDFKMVYAKDFKKNCKSYLNN